MQPSREDVQRAAEGDAIALGSLLRAIRGPVAMIVRRILGAHADAEDAIQQTLIHFIHALPAYRGDAEPTTYARAIAVRTAVAFRRRAASAPLSTRADCDTESIPSPHASPRDEAMAEGRRTLLRRLLGEIPPEQAEALAMRIVLGWSLEEVAAHAGVPLNTVRSRVRLAKESLRKKIEAEPGMRDALSFL